MNVAEKWNNYKTWKKAKIEEFNEKHPKLSNAIIHTQMVIGVGLAFAVTYAVGYSDGQIKLTAQIEAENNRRKEQQLQEPILAPWKEEYKENYEKATEFGDSLKMAEGEQIVISDSSVYNDPTLKPVIIDHYIYNKPCYPPNEDIKWI